MTTAQTHSTSPAPLKKAKRELKPLNGVDVPTLFATIGAVRDQPELANFKFRSTTRWIKGTHSQAKLETFTGAGGEHTHKKDYTYDSDHPAVLVGADEGASPTEYVLIALGACLTAGIGNIAAARGITLDEVEAKIEGEINLQGLLGLSDEVRNGYQGIKVSYKIRGDAPAEKLRAIVEQSKNRSPVFDVITNKVPVQIEVDAG